MKRLIVGLVMGVLTFSIGVSASLIWLSSNHRPSPKTDSRPPVSLVHIVESEHVEHSVEPISVRQHPDYAKLPIALEELVAQDARQKKNTFYVSKIYPFPEPNMAWVYWKENRSLILLEPGKEYDGDWKHALLWSRRYLHWNKEIVSPKHYYQGSNFLTLKQDAREMIKDCMAGDEFILSKEKK